ncbi:hypothetical protein F4679DRAFT_502246 [Xylaria curta]|nr:hypothetical protein F4679DRAFT_502246 [Xylaria curta]
MTHCSVEWNFLRNSTVWLRTACGVPRFISYQVESSAADAATCLTTVMPIPQRRSRHAVLKFVCCLPMTPGCTCIVPMLFLGASFLLHRYTVQWYRFSAEAFKLVAELASPHLVLLQLDSHCGLSVLVRARRQPSYCYRSLRQPYDLTSATATSSPQLPNGDVPPSTRFTACYRVR